MGRSFWMHVGRIQGRWWAVCIGDLVIAALWFWLAGDGGGEVVRVVALAGAALAFASAVVFLVMGYTEARKPRNRAGRDPVRTGNTGTG